MLQRVTFILAFILGLSGCNTLFGPSNKGSSTSGSVPNTQVKPDNKAVVAGQTTSGLAIGAAAGAGAQENAAAATAPADNAQAGPPSNAPTYPTAQAPASNSPAAPEHYTIAAPPPSAFGAYQQGAEAPKAAQDPRNDVSSFEQGVLSRKKAKGARAQLNSLRTEMLNANDVQAEDEKASPRNPGKHVDPKIHKKPPVKRAPKQHKIPPNGDDNKKSGSAPQIMKA